MEKPVKPYSTSSKEHIEITKLVAEMIVKDMQPFDLVSSPSFRKLLKKLDPR